MHTLRQLHGISGFTNRQESEYDCFGAGHSSTSISAALGKSVFRYLPEGVFNHLCVGMAVGKNLLSKQVNNCIAVIGDGAITGGMAYEAMNNAAYINTRIVVILNDNGQVKCAFSHVNFALKCYVFINRCPCLRVNRLRVAWDLRALSRDIPLAY